MLPADTLTRQHRRKRGWQPFAEMRMQGCKSHSVSAIPFGWRASDYSALSAHLAAASQPSTTLRIANRSEARGITVRPKIKTSADGYRVPDQGTASP